MARQRDTPCKPSGRVLLAAMEARGLRIGDLCSCKPHDVAGPGSSSTCALYCSLCLLQERDARQGDEQLLKASTQVAPCSTSPANDIPQNQPLNTVKICQANSNSFGQQLPSVRGAVLGQLRHLWKHQRRHGEVRERQGRKEPCCVGGARARKRHGRARAGMGGKREVAPCRTRAGARKGERQRSGFRGRDQVG